MKKGLKILCKTSIAGTYIATGLVKNHKAVGCPKQDVLFILFHRPGEKDSLFCLRPDEAVIISEYLAQSVMEYDWKRMAAKKARQAKAA